MFKLLLNPCRMCRTNNCSRKEHITKEIDELLDKYPHLSVNCNDYLSILTSYPEETRKKE